MKYSKEDKPERAGGAGAGSRAVPVALVVVVLCAFSFYLGGIYSTGRSLLDSIQPAPTALLALGAATTTRRPSDDGQARPALASTAAVAFPECPADYQDYTPCTDPKRWRRYGNYRLSFMERHCPPPPDRQQCLVPPPKGYKPPIRWPKSKDQCCMCFKLYSMKGDIAVWQKSADACYDKLTPVTTPAKCDDSVDPDAAWYVPMRSCVTAPSPKYRKLGLNATPKWPQRLSVAPERISVVPGSSAAAFKQDDARWKLRVKHYKTLLPALGSDKIRNVMDMNTVYGGFAGSLIKDPVWVMNVVSSYGPNSLGVVYDRGLIGVNHDWCEAFSTYPRTYDLLHLDGLFTAESHRCEMKYVLLEMDRILRPTGYAIIRESTYFLDSVAPIAKGMRWSCEKHSSENKADKDKILVCQKKLWAGKQ
ncbi:hypothetical protein ZEAMMB73_Zm00001d030163 [Zea mays]|uniref:Methyltransferase n=1 Tax=Zea mays TaxID=4577 RepID=A0A1D6KAB1_MAIZE|nr:hypothetical protein ZEAMMB73_Zm00001d030163 [Zea mays]